MVKNLYITHVQIHIYIVKIVIGVNAYNNACVSSDSSRIAVICSYAIKVLKRNFLEAYRVQYMHAVTLVAIL